MAMKPQISKRILTKSALRKTSFGYISKLQAPPKGMEEDVPRAIQEGKKEEKNSLHKLRQELNSFAGDITEQQDTLMQSQTEIHEETLTDDDQTKLAKNIKEMVEVQNEISTLKDREEKLRDQVMYARNMKEKYQAIERIILEINEIQSQKPETEGLLENVSEIANTKERVTGHPKKQKHIETFRENINVSEHEINKYEVQVKEEESVITMRQDMTKTDMTQFEYEKQKQSTDSRKDLHKSTMEMDIASTNIHRLKEEIYRTKELLQFIIVDFEKLPLFS